MRAVRHPRRFSISATPEEDACRSAGALPPAGRRPAGGAGWSLRG